MNTRDRAFLHDMQYLISLNRIAAVRTLYEGIRTHEAIARDTLQTIYSDRSASAIAAQVTELNEGSRIIQILVAKIFVELLAAWEDLGAFGLFLGFARNTSMR